jgi:hypothetical protein
MVHYEVKSGVQTITEVCDDCTSYIRDLSLDDILVKGDTDMIIKNSQGEVVTNTAPRPKCYCEDCSND